MPLDPTALGERSEPRVVSWDADDSSLYALGVGAGTDELEFTTENTRGLEQRTLSTQPVTLGMDVSVLRRAGKIDWARLVHGTQRVEIDQPLPPQGTADAVTEIAEMWDKGADALVVLETTARLAEDGSSLFRSRTGLFLRGAGGWGGERGRSLSTRNLPDRAPDHTVSYLTRPDQALIYRLSGDHNPLHSDPAFAARAGFDRPILHGLCTFGFAGRAVLHACADGDPIRIKVVEARFVAPVFPGDTLRTEIWSLDDGGLAFRTLQQDEQVVLDRGRCELT